MGIIVFNGSVKHTDDFALFEAFAAENKTKVVSVELWGFERLPIGQLCIRWKNGAIAHFVSDSLTDLHEYVADVAGWPKPILYSRLLPHSSGCLLVNSQTTEEEPEVEETHVTKRVVRQRHSEPEVIRRRRVRAEAV